MKNAHERFGWLEFEKQLKDTRTRLRVALDRFISEPAENKEASGTCHLVSVFGNDVDIGAIWAGLAGQCPEAQFIIGNSAGFTSSRLGRKESGMTTNYAIEISLVAAPPHDEMAQLLAILGENRILFGTGMPFHYPDPALVKMDLLDAPESAKDKIRHRNAMRLLKLA